MKKIEITVKKWIMQESKKASKDMKKLDAYESSLSVIGFYAQLRGLDLKSNKPKKSSLKPDRGDFNKEQAKVYNIILGLGRHLGFDPGLFRPIEDDMFDMTEEKKGIFRELERKIITYIRHHFRNNPDRASIKLLDQVLIDKRSHTFWEKVISEDEGRVAIQVLENLVKYKDPIEKIDIENEFNKFGDDYLWIMEKWFNDPRFERNRELFNARKDQIKAVPLNDFIEKNYPQAYSKFFNDMLKTRRVSVRKIIETLHPSVDVSQLLNLGINDDHIGPYVPVFTEILRLFNYPVYI